MDNRALTLNKRLKTDRYINIVFVIVEFLIGLIQLIQFIRTGDTMALRRSIHAIFGAAALFLLSLILKRIAITGKPFDTKIINLMKIIAVVIMVGGLLPPFAEGFVEVTKGNTFDLNFGDIDILIPLAGVIVGIISEIFVYGNELQEDNDLIA